MTGTLLRAQNATTSYSAKEVFFCPEESHFYSHCLERLVFNCCASDHDVIEFGCGDGSPVINSLMRCNFNSKIYGYELNAAACEVAQFRIQQCNLEDQYIIHSHSFFESDRPEAHYLIANPPYLPAQDNQICMPLLHGGNDGATITNRLLELDYPCVMLLVSSYSNPGSTIEAALAQGYHVADFMVTPLKFGYYSSETKVKKQISALRRDYKAFFSKNIYFLAGVLFKKQNLSPIDISTELMQVMTAL